MILSLNASFSCTQNLLHIFWHNHDPCVKHKRQYMSAIFYQDEEQKREAQDSLQQQSRQTARTIHTLILPAETFYDAEDYHQKYRLRGHTYVVDALHLTDKDIVDLPIATRLNGYLNGYGSVDKFDQEADQLNLGADLKRYLRSAIANAVRHC